MLRNFIRLSLLLAGVSLLVGACGKDEGNGVRDEYISVYLSKDAEEPVTELSVPCAGGEFDLYVKSDIDFSTFWQDDKTTPWVSVKSVDADGDWSVIRLDVSPISKTCYYTRRSGTLTLNVPEKYFGTFITLHQGLTARLSSDFSWLKYGSADPFETTGEQQFQKWTGTSLKWESTAYTEDGVQACYGKYGWFYIGDTKGTKADIITPYVNGLQRDSLLMVSFKAVAYTSEDGTPDLGKLRFEVLGGGVIMDYAEEGRTYMDIDLNNFSVEDPDNVAKTMWNVKTCAYNVFLVATEKSPFTGDTQIRLTTPDGNGKPNRVALDGIYIRKYTIDEKVQDEDVFKANGGSGLDRITAGLAEDESDKTETL